MVFEQWGISSRRHMFFCLGWLHVVPLFTEVLSVVCSTDSKHMPCLVHHGLHRSLLLSAILLFLLPFLSNKRTCLLDYRTVISVDILEHQESDAIRLLPILIRQRYGFPSKYVKYLANWLCSRTCLFTGCRSAFCDIVSHEDIAWQDAKEQP